MYLQHFDYQWLCIKYPSTSTYDLLHIYLLPLRPGTVVTINFYGSMLGHAEIKHSYWLEIVMVLGIVNQSALFQHKVDTLLYKLQKKSIHFNYYKEYM